MPDADSLPDWAGEAVARDLAELTELPHTFSIMEPGICERIARAFEKNPWVKEVVCVSKQYPNVMKLKLRLRRPVAGVYVGGKYYLVDVEGRRLTPGSRDWPEGTGVPPLIVSKAQGVPERGEPWSDDAVLAGAAVAATLDRNEEKLSSGFRFIDVRGVGARRPRLVGDIVLVTHQNTTVRWGRSPLAVNLPGELTPREKIDKMVLFEKRRGPLSSYEYVDIRFDNIQHGRPIRALSARAFNQ
jgi:hypothetical protein